MTASWAYPPMMEFGVLGPFTVTTGHGSVEIPGVKERTLLAHLVAEAGHLVPVESLVESLWGEAPPRAPLKALQTYVLRVRNVLEPDRGATPRVVVTDGGGYRLAVARESVDAHRFADLADRGRRELAAGRSESALPPLRDASRLWRGPAYAGFESTGFGAAEARRLHEMRAAVEEDRWTAELAVGNAAATVPEVERLLERHPFRERLWALLMRALYQLDRQGEALAAYQRARETLSEELGVDPGQELRDLHARVLAHDPALRPAARRLPPRLDHRELPLVGRDAELATLRAAWRRTGAGDAVVVTLRGEVGAGATRLLAELAAEVVAQGAEVRDGGTPAPGSLTVVDGRPVPGPRGSLVVGRVPTGSDGVGQVVDLGPLTPAQARELLAPHVAEEDLDEACRSILGSGVLLPGALLHRTAQWSHHRAATRVRAGADRLGRSTQDAAAARAELTSRLLDLQADPPSPAPAATCPWRGLRSYDAADAAWYAGRERLVAQLVAAVAGSNLVSVVGASGSGKSSLVHAGLLARLAEGCLPGSDEWTVVTMRPGRNPMAELARRTLAAVGHPSAVGDVLAQLVNPGRASRTLVVVDQLEEAWTICPDAGERTAFLDVLAELAADDRGQTSVLLVLRADYVSSLADHPGLARSLTEGTVLVGVPTAAEVRRSVTVPASRSGVRFETGLDDTIVSDAGAEPGVLPLLSVALTRLWEQRDGAVLGYATYVAMGGVAGAIAAQAERAWSALDPAGQSAARVLLLRLASSGTATDVVRRRVPLAELAGLGDEVPAVVDALVAARLLTLGDDTVEVAHESLFRQWPRLAGWLAEDAAGRDVQHRLAAATAEWAAEDEDPSLLWRGPRLDAALAVAEARPEELTDTEHAFLSASWEALDAEVREARERAATATSQNRRLRGLVVGAVALLVLALVAGGLAWGARQEAVTAGERERAAAVTADAKRLAAQAVNEEQLDLALLEAVEAVRTEQVPETYGALLTLLARVPDLVTQVRSEDLFLEGASTPDGRTLFLSEYEPLLWAVDARTGRIRWQVEVPLEGHVTSLEHGPAGLLGALGGDGGSAVVLWDPGTGEERWRIGTDELADLLGPRSDPVPAEAAWSGKRVAILTGSHVVLADDRGRFVDAYPTGVPIRGGMLRTWPDGRLSFEAPWDVGHLLDPRTGRVRELPFTIDAVSPDGRLVVTADRSVPDRVGVRLRDAETLEPVGQEMVVSSYDGGLAWSSDGRHIALGAGETLQVHDLAGRLVDSYGAGHTGAIMSVQYAGPGRVWTGGRDGVASLWDLRGSDGFVGEQPLDGSPHTGDAASAGDPAVFVRFHQDRLNDAQLVSPDRARVLGGPLPLPGECRCQPVDVAMAGDASVAVGALQVWRAGLRGWREDRGRLAMWSPTGDLVGHVDLPWDPVGVDVTNDGTRAVVSGSRGVALVDLRSRTVTHTVRRAVTAWPPATDSVRFSPDAERVVVVRDDGVLVLDADDGQVIVERALGDGQTDAPTTAAWSRDGSTLSIGTLGGRLHFLGAADLAPRAPSRLAVAGFVVDQTTSPDGRLLATLGSDGDVRLWDTATWAPLGLPLTELGQWGFLSFTGDGDRLRVLYEASTADGDGTVRTLPVSPQAWVERACAVANRQLTAEEFAVVRPAQEWRPTCP